ncbi:transmembrane protein [Planoprotostelium fungivorum]|uniref:Glycerophosphocholine acyltransferase 1 n=2 Tax=Planoprotostelium fungivorum TaxID=1890364 RepID=A0A2P6NC88_9EUKA|nr:transmembrane protein [Planoprotostelium fungivorum]
MSLWLTEGFGLIIWSRRNILTTEPGLVVSPLSLDFHRLSLTKSHSWCQEFLGQTDTEFVESWLPAGRRLLREDVPSPPQSPLMEEHHEPTHHDWEGEGDDSEFSFDVIPKSPAVTNIVKRVRTDREKLREYVRKKKSDVKLKIDNPPAVKLRDKISFTLGVADAIVSGYLLGHAPNAFVWKYNIQLPLLMFIRFWYYRSIKYHYFLLDFCYYANLILALYLQASFTMIATRLIQYSLLLKTAHYTQNGPLMWAIAVWRLSIVFHSLDKVTSLFIHLNPPLVMWAIRWHSPEGSDYQHCVSEYEHSLSFSTAVLFPLVPYIAWQLIYYVIVQIVRRKKFKADPERLTSFIWMQRDGKSLIGRWMKVFGRKYEIFMFGILQLIFTFVVMLPIQLLHHSYVLHTGFVLSILLLSAWNGSSFYFEVFSKRYQAQLKEYEQEWQVVSEALKTSKRSGESPYVGPPK